MLVFTRASVVLIAAGAILSPAVAHADAQDDQFLAAVAAKGITAPADQLIAFARQMCTDDVAGNFGVIGAKYAIMASAGLSPMQMLQVELAGFNAYCPARINELPFIPNI